MCCGIVGFAKKEKSPVSDKCSKFISTALFVDTLRGFDSTGIAVTNHDNNTSIYKRAVPGYDFIDLNKYRKIMYKIDHMRCVIGHNRAATVGSVTNETAHPYNHGQIYLAHNGTLQYNTGMEGTFETDSEEIAYTMNKNGAEATLPKINGAYALSWYDDKAKTVNLARNTERPLHYAASKDGSAIFWASEASMLEFILTRARINYCDIISVTPHTLYTFSLDDQEIMYTSSEYKPTPPVVHKPKTYHNNKAMVTTSVTSMVNKYKLHSQTKLVFEVTDMSTMGGQSKVQRLEGDVLYTMYSGTAVMDVSVVSHNFDKKAWGKIMNQDNTFDPIAEATITHTYISWDAAYKCEILNIVVTDPRFLMFEDDYIELMDKEDQKVEKEKTKEPQTLEIMSHIPSGNYTDYCDQCYTILKDMDYVMVNNGNGTTDIYCQSCANTKGVM